MFTPSERSGSDLLMQSAGLLIICHTRWETTHRPTKFGPAQGARGRFTGRSHRIPSIVKSGVVAVKPARPFRSVAPAAVPADDLDSVQFDRNLPMSMDAQRSFSFLKS